MRKSHSEKLSIEKISDLVKHQDILRWGFTSEFLERPDGFEGLRKKYGIQFKIRVQPRSSQNRVVGLYGDALKINPYT